MRKRAASEAAADGPRPRPRPRPRPVGIGTHAHKRARFISRPTAGSHPFRLVALLAFPNARTHKIKTHPLFLARPIIRSLRPSAPPRSFELPRTELGGGPTPTEKRATKALSRARERPNENERRRAPSPPSPKPKPLTRLLLTLTPTHPSRSLRAVTASPQRHQRRGRPGLVVSNASLELNSAKADEGGGAAVACGDASPLSPRRRSSSSFIRSPPTDPPLSPHANHRHTPAAAAANHHA